MINKDKAQFITGLVESHERIVIAALNNVDGVGPNAMQEPVIPDSVYDYTEMFLKGLADICKD